MPTVDIHTHAFPDDLAGRAIEKLSSAADWRPVGDGTIKDLLKSMDRSDVDISAVCAIATKPGMAKGILKWCKKIRSQRIEPLPSVHPRDGDAVEWVDRIAGEGFHGMKLHPMYQDFNADDPIMDPIYAAAALHGLAVTMHCGQDIAFPPDDDRASPGRIANLIKRHARLKLLCTHLGGYESWDEAAEKLLGQHVLLETSFSLARLGPEKASKLIAKHGARKVLFGSDWPWKSQADEIALIKRLDIPDRDKQRILFGNGAKLLGY
ncbi:MAG: amidohydrolase family protein [Planctomycetes bacterium]|nr:amidohydrolase family protein [Planctomycetota bacterium]